MRYQIALGVGLAAALLMPVDRADAQPAQQAPPVAPKAVAPKPPRARVPALRVFEGPDGRYGFKDRKGKVVLAPVYEFAYEFNAHGVAAVVEKGRWVWIDPAGKTLLVPYVFDNGPDYESDGLHRYVEGGKVGFGDGAARVVIPARFEFVEPFQNGRARYCEGCTKVCDGEHCHYAGGTWGAIGKTGEVIPEPPAQPPQGVP